MNKAKTLAKAVTSATLTAIAYVASNIRIRADDQHLFLEMKIERKASKLVDQVAGAMQPSLAKGK